MPYFKYFPSPSQVDVKVISYLPEMTKEKIMQLLPSCWEGRWGDVYLQLDIRQKKNLDNFPNDTWREFQHFKSGGIYFLLSNIR